MAESTIKESRKMRNTVIPGGLKILQSSLQGILKERKKSEDLGKTSFLQQYNLDGSQSSNISKENLNELATNGKTNSTPNSRKLLSHDPNDDAPEYIRRIPRASRFQSNSNEFCEYTMNAGHNKKGHRISDEPISNVSNNNTYVSTSNAKSFCKHDSNSEQSNSGISQTKFSLSNDKPYKEHREKNSYSRHHNNDTFQDNMQIRGHVRFHKNTNGPSEYHMNAGDGFQIKPSYKPSSSLLNSDSNVDISCVKTSKYSNCKRSDSSNTLSKNSDKNWSNFNHSNFEYNNAKKTISEDSFRNKCKPHLISTKMHDNKKEESSSNAKWDFRNQFEDENTEIKHERLCSELPETIKDSTMKNIMITIKPRIPHPTSNASFVSSSSLPSSVTNEPISSVSNAPIALVSNEPIFSVSNEPISSVFNTPTPTFSNSTRSSVSSISSPSSILNTSPVSSLTIVQTNYDLPLDIGLSKVFEMPNLSPSILISSNDNLNFIPPPVSCESPSISGNSSTSTGKNILQNNGEELTDVSSDGDDFPLPDSEHLEAISKFILKVVKERSVSSTTADKVVNDLNRLFKDHFEGNVIDYYGSYYTNLAISTSNINLVIQTEFSVRKSFMVEIYNILSQELEQYHVHQYEEGSTAHKIKINLTHPDTGINCELAYLGRRRDQIFEMGKFLKAMCLMNQHVRPLIIATKVWAEHLNINEVEDGKLHPIGFALLVIHFLQHCRNPILPVYSLEEEVMEKLPQNDSSIGELWLGFLAYYAFTFNWQEDVLTVTSQNEVSKKSKKWENYWIAIEDPFTGKNIAESVVNKDVADYIQSCFKESYRYFLNGPGITPLSDNEENQSSAGSSSSLMEFSFNDCIVEQSENNCEMCDEIDDICQECKKKIYVQPMVSLPKMTDESLKVVEQALFEINDKYMLSDKEVNERKCFVKKLEAKVCRLYPDAQMRLFGSSANGFGFKNSDLDICLTFSSKEEHKTSTVLCKLRSLLRKDKDFTDVIAIFNATIPILKFRHKLRGWRGDISMDNVLAVHNSELLYTYSLIDERCRILGCALKLIAKKALIAEVTEKALSSYSYLIMVIHFLQQIDPPVLPILQDNQFRENHFELGHIVENCSVWFCKNINYIRKTFKSENHTPVAQLFLDLLDYYCSFDTTQLISIKQKEIMPVCEGMPTARLFNIQDPFLVTKNLGRVVDAKKAQETKNVLNKARILFRTPKKEVSTDFEGYFFSTMNLTGRYQKEALCDFCGKFGHEQNDCKNNNYLFKWNPRHRQYANQKWTHQKKTDKQTAFMKKF